jgi:hypothetical protein
MARLMSKRGAKVAVSEGVKVRKVSETLVGDRGLVVVWEVIATGEQVEQKYVRRSDRWQRYEEWLGEKAQRAEARAREAFGPARWVVRGPTDQEWEAEKLKWNGDRGVKWFM